MTTAGVGVRTIGASVILGTICGLAANTDMIVVGVWDRSSPAGGKQVLMFDFVSGDLLRSFGVKGTAEGQLHGIVGIRFTPDDRHIILAETDGNRLSLFTLTGDFVRCIGVGTLSAPWDVDFATNGDILVADSSNHRICVFSPDGSTLLRAFGSEGSSEPGTFKHPIALAMHAGQLYVLDWKSARVQVFS